MKLNLRNSQRHIDRLRNIANVVSGDMEVRVRIDPKVQGPYFSFSMNEVVLPDGDYSDPRFVALCEGFISHEAGHSRFTSFSSYEDAVNLIYEESEGFLRWELQIPIFTTEKLFHAAWIKAKRVHGLINLFDDIQMERQTGFEFPRAKETLSAMYRIMVEDKRMTCDVRTSRPDPVQFIEMYILNKLRNLSLSQSGHPETLNEFYSFSECLLAPVLDRVNGFINDSLNICSSDEAAKQGVELYEFLEGLLEKSKQQLEEQQEDTDDASNDEDSEPTSTEPLAKDLQSESDEDHEPTENTEESEGESNQSDNSKNSDGADKDSHSVEGPEEDDVSDADGNPDAGKQSNFSNEDLKSLIDVLEGFINSDVDSPDHHDLLKEMIAAAVAEVSYETKAEFGVVGISIDDFALSDTDYTNAKNTMRKITGHLAILQNMKTRGMRKTSDRGVKIDNRRLVLASMGVTDIFKSRSIVKGRGDVGIVVLRDISGSMALDKRYISAVNADIALSLAIQSLPKLNVANVVFPIRDTKECKVVKPFSRTVESCFADFGMGFSGSSTPTATALQFCTEMLSKTTYQRKIILLLTDGQPSEEEFSVEAVLRNSLAQGIEVAGIGINTDVIQGFHRNNFANVDDISELGRVVYDLVLRVLINN